MGNPPFTFLTLFPEDCKYYNILCYCTHSKAEVVDLETGNKMRELLFGEHPRGNPVIKMFLMSNDNFLVCRRRSGVVVIYNIKTKDLIHKIDLTDEKTSLFNFQIWRLIC